MVQADKPDNHSAPDPALDAGHLIQEADIGSGEKSPGEKETEEQIKSIPPLPENTGRDVPPPKP